MAGTKTPFATPVPTETTSVDTSAAAKIQLNPGRTGRPASAQPTTKTERTTQDQVNRRHIHKRPIRRATCDNCWRSWNSNISLVSMTEFRFTKASITSKPGGRALAKPILSDKGLGRSFALPKSSSDSIAGGYRSTRRPSRPRSFVSVVLEMTINELQNVNFGPNSIPIDNSHANLKLAEKLTI